ncbi:MAG TPA: hypothetical protein PKA13_20445 [Geminicoccaceae bacterium]|nr:hypothetical protein [Geminicoccus sp.]HMU52159.1 hypothetical protein [Geminicoccaceae bacterium]
MAKGMLIAAAMLAGTGAMTPAAVTTAAPVQTIVTPVAAFAGDVGDRHVVGYYLAEAGACAVTMMLAYPAGDDAPAAGASRLSMTLQPQASAALDDGQGERLAVTCGAGARHLVVDRRPGAGRMASR